MYGLNNDEKFDARRFDAPMRASQFTDIVYSGGTTANAPQKMDEFNRSCDPQPSEYNIYFGEMHGHTNLSDALPDIDTYFTVAKNLAQLDFCAISDHDHGGVHSTELWDDAKWNKIKQTVEKFNEPNKFTTILAYERDAYPWYNNIVVYFNSHDKDIPRGSINGEITKEELKWFLKQDDLFIVPHTTSFLQSGCDFAKIDSDLMTPLIEVYSRWGTDEYFGNPNPVRIACRGGYWHDALKKGAKMGCICGSDDHESMPGMVMDEARHINLKYVYPGLTAVLAKENTLESIFEAIRARRCYGFMGGRIYIDFRINGHYMGEEFDFDGKEKSIYFNVRADKPIKRISLVKNCEDYMHFDGLAADPLTYSENIVEYEKQSPVDFYYIRVELADGRFAWTSPIWVNNK